MPSPRSPKPEDPQLKRLRKAESLAGLEEEIRDRKAYLATIEEGILVATENGHNAIRDLLHETQNLEAERARLMKQLFSLRQDIREASKVLQ